MYIKIYKPYTLAGFEPGIFCFVGGREDNYATLQGHLNRKHTLKNLGVKVLAYSAMA
jgi:hypothetical protein